MHLGEQALGLAGLAGWVGWIFGIAAGVLEVRKWRSDRREGPVIRELVERELRDKEGTYTEEQIHELTNIFESLQRQIREDVPAVARRTLIESRRSQLAESIEKDYREYSALGEKLENTPAENRLSPELRESIRNEIAPSVERRGRQVRGTIAIFVVIGLLIVFPYPQRFLGSLLDDTFGYNQNNIEENYLSYLVGVVVALIFALYSPWSRFQGRIARTSSLVTIGLATGCICLWLLGITSIWRLWVSNSGVQNFIAIVSLIFFGVGIRIFYIFYRWRRIDTR